MMPLMNRRHPTGNAGGRAARACRRSGGARRRPAGGRSRRAARCRHLWRHARPRGRRGNARHGYQRSGGARRRRGAPAGRRARSGPGAARPDHGLHRHADLRAHQRLSESLEFRYRRACPAGRPAGPDRDARSRPAVAPGARATGSDAGGARAVAGKHGTCQGDDRPLLGPGSPGLDEPAAGRPGSADVTRAASPPSPWRAPICRRSRRR